MIQVDYILPAVAEKLEQWAMIRAAIEGEEAVKRLGEKVLPRPNATDTSPENLARYTAYLGRACWYGVSGRTLQGMAGYVFAKEPVLELPKALEPIKKNVDGAGVTLTQQAKQTLRFVLAFGRAGLLVDYPVTLGRTTQKDILDGKVSPTIILYAPENVINWRYSYNGSRARLDFLVLREEKLVLKEGSEFESETVVQFRVISRTDEGGVVVRVFRRTAGTEPDWALSEGPNTLTGKDGKPLQDIPFTFVGAVNNDSTVDAPPLLDLVNLNFAHFRNSADYEESCFIVGQPTPFFAGLSTQWVNEVLKGTIEIGARAAVLLPVGGTAGLLQAAPNSMPFEGMEHKELQMVAIGAKLVEQKKVQRTATEAGLEHAAEASVLVTAAENVFMAYRVALNFCALFVQGEGAKIDFELAEPLTRDSIEAPQAVALMELWNQGLVGFEEARWKLKQAGLAYMPDEQVKAEGEAKKKADQEAELAMEKVKSQGREKAGAKNGKKGSRKEVKAQSASK
jgi:hypothetical protein